MDREALYRRSPIALQHVFATAYGLRERRLRYGGRYREDLAELRAAEHWPRERLEARQVELLRDLLAFCQREIPHYRAQFDEHGVSPARATIGDLARLPLLEKDIVREDPDRFVARSTGERLVAQTTGGTTGTPLRYLVTPSAVRFSYATYEARFRNWAGVRFGDRMASINGKVVVPVEQAKPPFWRRNLAFNQLYLSAYHLAPAHLPSYLDELERFRPVVIVGYTSAVHALAQFVLEQGAIGLVRPRAVLVSSETLVAPVRADIEAAFGCKVHDGYGLGELSAFISECEAGSMHVSPEYGVVEVGEAGPGGGGELVATGLRNFGMPLLRYRTGDVCRPAFDRTCPCGRELPVVDGIEGRVDDVVVTADGGSMGPAALSLAFQSVPHLRQAQLHQWPDRRVVVEVTTGPGFDADAEAFLVTEVVRRLGPLPVAVERVPAITRTSGGKQRVIVRHG